MNIFPFHATDSYKLGHRQMYQPGTDFLYSNFTPRGDRLFKGSFLYDHKMVVFGISGFIQEFIIEQFNREFFSKPKSQVVGRYKRRMDTFLGEGAIPVDGVAALHDLGFLPLEIRALPEGSRVKMGVPVLTICNTHKDFAWLVNYLETVLSASIWKPMVNATIAFEYRRVFDHFAELTGSPAEGVMWQGHDFSARGMSGPEDAARCGAAHLTRFAGSDTVSAIDYLEDYYGADADKELIAASVPATEHSVSSTNILFLQRELGLTQLEAETEFMRRYITEIVPTGIASYVADTYDYWAVVTEVVPSLKDVIMARDGKLVIRPDSGDPVAIIVGESAPVNFASLEEAIAAVNEEHFEEAAEACEGSYCMGCDEYTTVVQVGDKYYELTTKFEYNRHDKQYYYIDNYGDAGETKAVEIEPTAEQKGTIQCLWETFGGTITDKGYKLLDSHIGLIYGDSITLDRQVAILKGLEAKGFASGNVVFGLGSFTYNYSTRDTFGSAVKATATSVNDEFFEIFKDPKTGASKKSAKGLLSVKKDEDGEFYLVDQVGIAESLYDTELQVVYKDGDTPNKPTLAEIRQRLGGI